MVETSPTACLRFCVYQPGWDYSVNYKPLPKLYLLSCIAASARKKTLEMFAKADCSVGTGSHQFVIVLKSGPNFKVLALTTTISPRHFRNNFVTPIINSQILQKDAIVPLSFGFN